jgi:hypothetical protein
MARRIMKGLSRHDIARGNVSVECQGPQGSQRRVYILNVLGYVVHVQGVSLKSKTDYGRAGALISRCATIHVVRSTVLYGRENAIGGRNSLVSDKLGTGSGLHVQLDAFSNAWINAL